MAADGTHSQRRQAAIMEAVLEALLDLGYDKLTMDAVAARARASKATIYRRWQNKADMVIDALRHHEVGRREDLPSTGTLRGDLLAWLTALGEPPAVGHLRLMTEILHAARTDPQLARALPARQIDVESTPLHIICARAAARGEIPGEPTAMIAEVAISVPMMHLFTQRAVTAELAVRFTDEVLIPLLTRAFHWPSEAATSPQATRAGHGSPTRPR